MSLLNAKFHVREKQIDHLRWNTLELPNEVIIGKREMTREEQRKYQNDYMFRMMTASLTDVHRRHTEGNSDVVSLGFLDLPYNNSVQHQTRNVGLIFSGSTTNPNDHKSIAKFMTSLEKSLDPNNPVRLHWQNVDAHLSYLRAHFREKDRENQPKEYKDWIVNFPLSKNPFIVQSIMNTSDRDFDLFLIKAVELQTARSNGALDRKKLIKKCSD